MAFFFAVIVFFVLREVAAWFWKINTIIDTQGQILAVLEDIRDTLSEATLEEVDDESVEAMLEKKPKKAKVEKENPPK